MPVIINGEKYFRTAEVCRMVGISKNSLFRWLRKVVFTDVERRDSRGWRLFTEDEVDRLKAEVHRVNFVKPTKPNRPKF